MAVLMLMGILWADLNEPLAEAEVGEWIQGQVGGRPVSRVKRFRQLVRGRVLVARIKPGMSQDEVIRIAGAIPRIELPPPGGGGIGTQCLVLEINIDWRQEETAVNGEPCTILRVDSARAFPFPDLGWFLPE
jgi:hypothetical protein